MRLDATHGLIESSWCIEVTRCFIAEVDPEQNSVYDSNFTVHFTDRSA